MEALQPCDVKIHAGEYVTVIGPSGSGKSTFLNVAGLLDRPTGGRYILNGIDTSELSKTDRASIRAHFIGFVFQEFHLLPHRTAIENVALAQLYTGANRRKRIAAATEMLDRVGLSHRKEALPAKLSGGERQRVAIARALANAPQLLLCDEPTGNLDTATSATVLELLDELHADGLTILLITHDPEVSARGERTLQVRDGVVSWS
ncbi:ABC transporter ATP-binding protein [Micromonospora sp. Llam0]|uniref:ABC transporter ATP-binding protein n=1 Tax=Micromonospora sp. Llam0 TaxID=2485143 RepID=UPI001F471E73|nr:ABC transporter ATP-binding protein [Micromonospora sp. Llam0]